MGELSGKQSEAKQRVKESLEVCVAAVEFCRGHGTSAERHSSWLSLTVTSTEQSCPSLQAGPQATGMATSTFTAVSAFCLG